MTKSKSSTIAIVVLSVLLAAALASTIVLAAFNASRTATTTITFGNGITLYVNGISVKGGDEASDDNDYYWTATGTSGNTGAFEVNGDQAISLDEIEVRVTGMDAFVAIKATISVSGGTGSDPVAPAYASGMIPANEATSSTEISGKTGWYVYGSGTNASKLTVNEGEEPDDYTAMVQSAEIFNTSNDKANDFAGRKYTCTVKIVASDTLAGLAALMTD